MLLKKSGLLILFVLVFALCAGTANADVVYSVSNYVTSSVGLAGKSGSEHKVKKNLSVGLGGDIAAFAFKDHNGNWRAMAREYSYGANDAIYVWDPSDWKKPIINVNDWASNIHYAAASGRYLYVASYETHESNNQLSGEVIRIDMENDYKVDNSHKFDEIVEGATTYNSHAEAISFVGDKVCVLVNAESNSNYTFDYKPSAVAVFDDKFDLVGTVTLSDGSVAAKNSLNMIAHGGKLYVASVGGMQGSENGDVWEVDVANLTAKRVLTTGQLGVHGISSAKDGTVYLLLGGYDDNWDFDASIYITTAAKLSEGNRGEKASPFSGRDGYTWELQYDDYDDALWVAAGVNLELRGRDGTIREVFTPDDLGDNITSIAVLQQPKDSGGDGGEGNDGGGTGGDNSDGGEGGDGAGGDNSDGNGGDNSDSGGGDGGSGGLGDIELNLSLTPEEVNTAKEAAKADLGTNDLEVEAAKPASLSANDKVSDANIDKALVSSAIAVSQNITKGGAVVLGKELGLPLKTKSLAGEDISAATSLEDLEDKYSVMKYFPNGGGQDDLLARYGDTLFDYSPAEKMVKFKKTIIVVDKRAPSGADFISGPYGVKLTDKYLYVFDGNEDGKAQDPITLQAKSTGGGGSGGDDSGDDNVSGSGGGGGGCDASGAAFLGVLAVLAGAIRKYRGKK